MICGVSVFDWPQFETCRSTAMNYKFNNRITAVNIRRYCFDKKKVISWGILSVEPTWEVCELAHGHRKSWLWHALLQRTHKPGRGASMRGKYQFCA